jgi:pilus assembly protein CpaF
VLMAADLPVAAIHRQIESAVDIIVHISRTSGGKRSLTQIAEVAGVDPADGRVRIRDIFNLRGGTDSLQPTGYLPTFVEHLVGKNLLDPKFLYARQQKPLPPTNGHRKEKEAVRSK